MLFDVIAHSLAPIHRQKSLETDERSTLVTAKPNISCVNGNNNRIIERDRFKAAKFKQGEDNKRVTFVMYKYSLRS